MLQAGKALEYLSAPRLSTVPTLSPTTPNQREPARPATEMQSPDIRARGIGSGFSQLFGNIDMVRWSQQASWMEDRELSKDKRNLAR